MDEYLVQHIYWGDTSSDSDYLYGSVIHHYDRVVHFENLRFASGKTIKKWVSHTNYQHSRCTPALPILRPGRRYRLAQKFQAEPLGRAYLQLEFFNRQGEAIDLLILKKGEEEFTYPLEAFSYTVSLLSAGCQTVTFSHLSLYCQEKTRTIHLADEKRGYYSYGNYPKDIELVKHLIRDLRHEGEG